MPLSTNPFILRDKARRASVAAERARVPSGYAMPPSLRGAGFEAQCAALAPRAPGRAVIGGHRRGAAHAGREARAQWSAATTATTATRTGAPTPRLGGHRPAPEVAPGAYTTVGAFEGAYAVSPLANYDAPDLAPSAPEVAPGSRSAAVGARAGYLESLDASRGASLLPAAPAARAGYLDALESLESLDSLGGVPLLPAAPAVRAGYLDSLDSFDSLGGAPLLPAAVGARAGYIDSLDSFDSLGGASLLPAAPAGRESYIDSLDAFEGRSAGPPRLEAPGGRRNPFALAPTGASVGAPIPRERLAAMRDEASTTHMFDGERLHLKDREEALEGWALLPMTRFGRDVDDKSNDFKVVYHHASADEAATRTRHGKVQDAERGDYLVRIEGGRFVYEATDASIDTTGERVPNWTLNTALIELNEKKQAKHGRDATSREKAKRVKRLMKAGGRYIYVMNSSGQIFCGKNQPTVQHHSSFLAGGAVAGAGDMVLAGGELKLISNLSGHYRPGPAYLWQVVKQLELQGVALASVAIEVAGVKGKFASAAEFLGAIDPSADPRLFDAKRGLDACDRFLAASRA